METRCADRVQEAMESRLEDLRDFRSRINSYGYDTREWVNLDSADAMDDAIQEFSEYGLCFDYVEPDTYDDQPKGYFRYQLQYGGPTHEIRYHVGDRTCVEFWLLDWFDGACVELVGEDLELATWVFEWIMPHE
jgi:hypothetical protein